MIRLGDLSLAGVVILMSACSRDDGLVDPVQCRTPSISLAALQENPTNVLSMFVHARLTGADSIVVRFGESPNLDDKTPAFEVEQDSAAAVVLGLFPSTSYDARVVAFNQCGADSSGVLKLTTKALPADIPTYSASGLAPRPGFIVLAAGNYGLVLDNSGRVVWYRQFPTGPGLNFQAQPNGRYVARPNAAPGSAAAWVEVGPDGSITRTLTCTNGLPPRMHDMIALTDGSYWVLCDETHAIDFSSLGRGTLQVTGTQAQHLTASGNLIFSWSPFDHFDIDLNDLQAGDVTSTSVNWTHGNALDIDEDGNLLLSFRNLNEVTKIDVRTGDVIWRLGGSHNQFTFANVSAPAFSRQHGVRSSGHGVLLLDNLGEKTSRAERYELNEGIRVAQLSNAFTSSQGAIALIGGSTQALPGSHWLVSFGNGSGVEEYDSAGNVMWRLNGSPGYVFRAQRIRSLYRPGFDDPR